MGGDYYGGRDVVTSTSSAGYSDVSAKAVGVTQSLHSSMNPTRWAEENLQCENLDPIVFALDVTGSMGDWTKIIYDKMPMFYGQIMMQNYLQDPAISFCAIGDVTCDKAPLQITEFGQGREIDQLISKMYLEGGGGGNKHESYDLAAYFYATHVDLINPEFPFFFVTGDEGFWEKTNSTNILKIFGQGIKEKEINSNEMWNQLKAKFNVFHIKKDFHNDVDNVNIRKQWVEALGEERILNIKHPKACIDVMLGAIAITSGARNLESYIKDMKTRGQDKERILEVTKALKSYATKLEHKQVNVIKHKVNPLDVKKNEVDVNKNLKEETANSNVVNAADLQEVQELTEKLLIEDLDEDSVKYREVQVTLRKIKGDEIPKEFICPLTKEILYDPVMTSDGHSFERKAIECWLEKHDFSPVTGATMDSTTLLPNFALKQMIRNYVESNQ